MLGLFFEKSRNACYSKRLHIIQSYFDLQFLMLDILGIIFDLKKPMSIENSI